MTDSAWDTYWRGADSSAAFTGGGSSHPAVVNFWTEYFAGRRKAGCTPKLVDIAGGNGAVIESARVAFDQARLTCVDMSASAMNMLEKRFPDVTGLVADARAIPLESAGFDLVTSQFGIEYAGLDAIGEAVRLVAPGGQLAFLLHHKNGGIYRQCARSRDAIRKLQATEFIPRCRALFDTGFALARGGSREVYDDAAQQFAPALRAVEALMVEYGREVADGTVMRLYRDVRTMHEGMQNYEPADVLQWFDRMDGEIDMYAERMTAMCSVALDATRFESVCADLVAQGFAVLRAEPLLEPTRQMPLAWVLIAEKPA